MAYIGSVPAANYKTIRKQTITGNGGTTYTLDYPVGNEEEIEVYVNNVRQEPEVAYTSSGTSLVMTGTVAATDSFYVIFQGKAEQTIGIPEKQSNGTYVFAANTTVNGNVVISGTMSVGGSNISPVQSFRNKIINGNFDFWQRQTSNTNVVTGQYVADRWINIKAGTPTLNISRQAFTVGQTDVPNEPDYFYRANTISSTGAANNIYVSQRVESVKTLAGQTATLTFYAKADSVKNIAIEFVQNFGTNGSAEANGVNVNTFSLTSSWQQFRTTITLPSLSGKTVDSANANYLAVNFWLDAGSNFNSRTNSLGQQSGTFDIAQVQLEAGNVATPFEVRPLGLELALCQRYFSLVPIVGVGITNATTTCDFCVAYPVKMRGSATITASSIIKITNVTTTDYTQSAASVTNVFDNASTSAYIRFGNFTGLSAGAAYNARNADQFVTASAEL